MDYKKEYKLLKELLNAQCREDYKKYLLRVHPKFIMGKHIKYLADNIQDLIDDKLMLPNGKVCRILIISMPPQHGKSMSITETLPSWYMGNNPDDRVIIVGYNSEFSKRFGRRNLRKIQEFGKDVFDIGLSKERDDEFEIDGKQGVCISRGILSGITGNPGDLIIIDDPVKTREEANSQVTRDKIWDEYLNSVKTRLSATGKIILIMTRWHEDDLAGRIEMHEADKCISINIPIEAEENDVLGRNVGDPLFPEIGKDKEWMEEFKKSYVSKEGSRTWLALFMGKPSAIEGNLFLRKWFKFYTETPKHFDRVCMSVDCTFKDKETSDYVVAQVWGMYGLDCYLLDQTRARMNLPDTVSTVEELHKKYPKIGRIFIEDKANGPAVIQILQRKISGLIPINPVGGKFARAAAISGHVESGHIHLPEHGEITSLFLQETCAFPDGTHDDIVDSFTQAINRMMYYRTIERKQLDYVEGGTYTMGELKMKGFKKYQITRLVKDGNIKLIGGLHG